ncbi:zinc finger, CCHC-type containing LTR copia-type gag-polypeptide [Tanacetum coccineum]
MSTSQDNTFPHEYASSYDPVSSSFSSQFLPTEESAAEVLGLTTAHAIWTALETAYSNSSVERIHSLRDSLRNLSKGTSTVSDYGRQFKGASFETFSTAIRTTKPFITIRDLLSQADVNNANKTTLEGVVALVTQMGVEDVGAGVPLTASLVSAQWALCLLLSISSYLCLECCYIRCKLSTSLHLSVPCYSRAPGRTGKPNRLQLSRKIKVFKVNRSTEFVNHTVQKFFEDNGTLHRLSCPYTPQQNGRAERKHRHLVETGLAMLFHAHVRVSDCTSFDWAMRHISSFLESSPLSLQHSTTNAI